MNTSAPSERRTTTGVRERMQALLPHRREALAWAALASPMLLWLAGLWPAVMTNDSIDMLGQAIRGPVVAWHPPTYTAALGMSWTVAGSPVLLAFAQVVALSWVIRRVLGVAVSSGAHALPVYGFGVFLCAMPPVGAFAAHIWKDVPYTIGFLLVVEWFMLAMLHRLGRQDRADGLGPWVRLAVGLSLLVVMRPNGIIVALIVVLGVLALSIREWRRAVAVLAGVLVVVAFVRIVVHPMLGVVSAPAGNTVDLAVFDLSAVAQEDPDSLSRGTAAALEELAPLPSFAEGHNCHWAGSTFDRTLLYAPIQDVGALQSGWREELFDHPILLVGNHFCAASQMWHPIPSEEERSSYEALYSGVVDNDLGVSSDPLSDRLGARMKELISDSNDGGVGHMLLFRPAIWTLVVTALFLACSIRLRSAWLLVSLVPLAAQVLSVVAIFGPHYRYGAPNWIASLLMVPTALTLLVRRVDERPSETETETETEAEGEVEPAVAP